MNNEPEEVLDVHEIDGPARAYFEVYSEGKTGEDNPVPFIRLKYRTIMFGSLDEEITKLDGDMYIESIRRELRKVLQVHGAIIWWRIRPVIYQETKGKNKGVWVWRCRLETSPPLPDSFWASSTPWKVEGDDTPIHMVVKEQ